MPLTISLSGMDAATEAALRAAFNVANARLGGRCELVPDGEAEHVIVDMDSMYGPMSWLRLHAAGKQIIGLTSAPRVQTHYRLGRPFDEAALAALLQEIDTTLLAPATDAPAVKANAGNATASAVSVTTSIEAVDTHAVTTADDEVPASMIASDARPLIEAPSATDTPSSRTDDAPGPASADDAGAGQADVSAATPPVARTDTDGTADTPATPAPVAPPPDRDPVFADWLVAGALEGRLRYGRDAGPTLLLDADTHQYFGPSTLKPLTQYFTGTVQREDFVPVADDVWSREVADAGNAQPLQRLQWLAGLLVAEADLVVDATSPTRFTLNKWSQTEREYPRHFRIATAMMRGPATLAEVITASGVPAEEVVRFVNASLATGYAEPVADTPAAPLDAGRKGGFFSRLRRG